MDNIASIASYGDKLVEVRPIIGGSGHLYFIGLGIFALLFAIVLFFYRNRISKKVFIFLELVLLIIFISYSFHYTCLSTRYAGYFQLFPLKWIPIWLKAGSCGM